MFNQQIALAQLPNPIALGRNSNVISKNSFNTGYFDNTGGYARLDIQGLTLDQGAKMNLNLKRMDAG